MRKVISVGFSEEELAVIDEIRRNAVNQLPGVIISRNSTIRSLISVGVRSTGGNSDAFEIAECRS
jgi:hypothetical protein